MQCRYQKRNKVYWCEKKTSRWSEAVCVDGEVMLNQPDCLLWWDNWLDRWGKSSGCFHLDFRKPFDTLSHDLLTGKLRECRLDMWTVKWFESCVNDRSQGIGDRWDSGTGVVGGVSLVVSYKVQYRVYYHLTCSSVTWMKGQIPLQQVCW